MPGRFSAKSRDVEGLRVHERAGEGLPNDGADLRIDPEVFRIDGADHSIDPEDLPNDGADLRIDPEVFRIDDSA